MGLFGEALTLPKDNGCILDAEGIVTCRTISHALSLEQLVYKGANSKIIKSPYKQTEISWR